MRAILAALLLLLPLAAAADEGVRAASPKSFSSSAAPATVRLGQPFVYEVTIVDDARVRYVLPRAPQLGTLHVRGVELSRTEQGDEATTTARLEVAIFDALGETRLPDLTFTALGPEGPARLTVPGAPLTVEATAEGDELDDLRQQQEVLVFSPLPLWIGGGAIALCALALAAARAWRRRPRAAPAPGPRGSPEERALAALDALAARGPDGDGRQFYFELSAIVRGFLEEVTSLHAMEMTTSELVDALVAREVPGLSLAQLGAWLERGDLHRFARVPADPEAARADLEKARDIVRGVAAARHPPVEAAA